MALAQVTIMANQVEVQRLGYMGISLTHFDDDAEPAIAAGSAVEIGGALYEAAAEEAISGWAGIAVNSDVYIKLTAAGGSVTANFTATPPTWSAAKHGWYDGADRYAFKLLKDAYGNYCSKRSLLSATAQRIDGNLQCSGGFPVCVVGASETVLNYESVVAKFTTSTTYTKLKEIKIPYRGEISVYFEYRRGVSGSVYVRIYVNDSPVGEEKFDSSGSWQPWHEKINVEFGDRVQIYAKYVPGSSSGGCQNFRIRSDTDISNTILSSLSGYGVILD